jgi:hypothetical protein
MLKIVVTPMATTMRLRLLRTIRDSGPIIQSALSERRRMREEYNHTHELVLPLSSTTSFPFPTSLHLSMIFGWLFIHTHHLFFLILSNAQNRTSFLRQIEISFNRFHDHIYITRSRQIQVAAQVSVSYTVVSNDHPSSDLYDHYVIRPQTQTQFFHRILDGFS